MSELRRRLQLEALRQRTSPRPFWGPSLTEVIRAAGLDQDSSGFGNKSLSEQASSIAMAADAAGAVVHLEEDSGALESALVSLAERGGLGKATLLVERTAGSEHPSRIELTPLDEADIAQLVAEMLGEQDPPLGEAVRRASGGWPAAAVTLIRAAVARSPRLRPDEIAGFEGAELLALSRALLASASADLASLLGASAVLTDGREPVRIAQLRDLVDYDAERLAAAVEEGDRLGILLHQGDRIAFASAVHREAAYTALAAHDRLRLHERALPLCPEADLGAHTRHLMVAGERPSAAAAALRWAEVLLSRGGETRRVEELFLFVCTHGEPADRGRARFEPRLRSLLGNAPTSLVEEVKSLLGRLLVGRGEYREALELLAASAPSSAVLETRGLGHLYLGELDASERDFRALADLSADQVGLAARAHSLVGMVAQTRGDLPAATAAYDEALKLSHRAFDLHGAAIYAANLGAALREQAEFARALAPTAEAARALERLGKQSERAIALFNYGNLLLSVGDLEGADRAVQEAEPLAHEASLPKGYLALLRGDLARRRAELGAALAHYRKAATDFEALGPRERALALGKVAEASAEAGLERAADVALGELHATLPSGDADWHRTRARVDLALGRIPTDETQAALRGNHERAAAALRRLEAFSTAVLLGRAAILSGRGDEMAPDGKWALWRDPDANS